MGDGYDDVGFVIAIAVIGFVVLLVLVALEFWQEWRRER